MQTHEQDGLDTPSNMLSNTARSDVIALNRMYLLLARDLARLGDDIAEICGGIPRPVVTLLSAISIEEIDRICTAVGPVFLVRARWPNDVWQDVLQSALSRSDLPAAALAAIHE